MKDLIQILTDPENQPHQFVGDPAGLKVTLEQDSAQLRAELAAARARFESIREYANRVTAYLCPITKASLWTMVDRFGDEHNKRLAAIEAAKEPK